MSRWAMEDMMSNSGRVAWGEEKDAWPFRKKPRKPPQLRRKIFGYEQERSEITTDQEHAGGRRKEEKHEESPPIIPRKMLRRAKSPRGWGGVTNPRKKSSSQGGGGVKGRLNEYLAREEEERPRPVENLGGR